MAETQHTSRIRTGGIEPEHDEHHSHAVSLRLLTVVFVALLVLTWATVAVAQINLGRYDLLVAMALAVAKGALVVTVFMHLWWDSRFNAIALVGALAFVALLIGVSGLDVGEYRPEVEAYRTANPITVEPAAAEESSGEGQTGSEGESGGGH